MNDSVRAQLHSRLVALAERRARMDYALGVTMRAAYRAKVHDYLGYASFREYIEQLFHLTGRQTEERLRVAKALEELPDLAAALRDGELSWSVVRELTRVATEQTEARWIAATEKCTARQVERMVAGRSPGDLPTDPRAPDAERRTVVLDVGPSTFALWQEMRRVVTTELGGHVDDDALLATLARHVLGGGGLTDHGARDHGKSSYRISISCCPDCRVARQRAGGEDVVLDDATLEQASCDAEHLGDVDRAPLPRATQTIPPRIRRAVMERHGGRCAVPGCRHAAFVDLHHIERRADGGTHDPDGLVPLCEAHHRATHVGALVVRGTYSRGFAFEHADGQAYGSRKASVARGAVFATVLTLLVSMGYKQREAHALIDRARPHVGDDVGVEEALRSTLRLAPVPRGAGVRESRASYVAAPRYAAAHGAA
jgi:hypothetical protein